MTRILSYISSSLLFVLLPATVFAQQAAEATAERPALTEVLFRMMPLFLMVFIVFHFLVIRPQEKRAKTQRELIESLSKNEQVVTSSGIVGRVAGIEKDYILLEISNNVKVKFEPAHVVKRFEKEKS